MPIPKVYVATYTEITPISRSRLEEKRQGPGPPCLSLPDVGVILSLVWSIYLIIMLLFMLIIKPSPRNEAGFPSLPLARPPPPPSTNRVVETYPPVGWLATGEGEGEEVLPYVWEGKGRWTFYSTESSRKRKLRVAGNGPRYRGQKKV